MYAKKKFVLGVNTSEHSCPDKCCILISEYTFDELPEIIDATMFEHTSTNWAGRDDLKRTLEIAEVNLTGRKRVLRTPMVFTGTDYDWGKTYPWTFQVNELHEVVDSSVAREALNNSLGDLTNFNPQDIDDFKLLMLIGSKADAIGSAQMDDLLKEAQRRYEQFFQRVLQEYL